MLKEYEYGRLAVGANYYRKEWVTADAYCIKGSGSSMAQYIPHYDTVLHEPCWLEVPKGGVIPKGHAYKCKDDNEWWRTDRDGVGSVRDDMLMWSVRDEKPEEEMPEKSVTKIYGYVDHKIREALGATEGEPIQAVYTLAPKPLTDEQLWEFVATGCVLRQRDVQDDGIYEAWSTRNPDDKGRARTPKEAVRALAEKVGYRG